MHASTRPFDAAAQDAVEQALHEASRRHLAAIRASLDATRALAAAPPGGKADAYRRLAEALREQADAERAYERLRQGVRGESYAGRPRFRRY